MVPTPLALSLVQPVRDILLQVESVASVSIQFEPATSRRKISLLSSDYAVDVLLGTAIRILEREAPGMQIEVRPFTSAFVQDFEQGDLDLLITPRGYASERHPSEPLYTEDFTCVVWSGNTIVRNRLSFDQYKRLGHVCVNLGGWRISTYDEWFLKHRGNVRRIEVTVPSFHMGFQFVTGSQRILTCHRRHAKMYAEACSLRIVEAPFEIPPIELVMQWHKHKDQDPALAWFRNVVKSVAQDIAP
jgi:DNA-binding transcriptional LysR family regulator